MDQTEGAHAVPEGNGEQTVSHDLAAHLAAVDPCARARIEDWAKKLVDLSRRNRLLHYRPAKRTALVFREPDPTRIFSRLVDGKPWSFYLEHAIQDGSLTRSGDRRVISKQMLYVELDGEGAARHIA